MRLALILAATLALPATAQTIPTRSANDQPAWTKVENWISARAADFARGGPFYQGSHAPGETEASPPRDATGLDPHYGQQAPNGARLVTVNSGDAGVLSATAGRGGVLVDHPTEAGRKVYGAGGHYLQLTDAGDQLDMKLAKTNPERAAKRAQFTVAFTALDETGDRYVVAKYTGKGLPTKVANGRETRFSVAGFFRGGRWTVRTGPGKIVSAAVEDKGAPGKGDGVSMAVASVRNCPPEKAEGVMTVTDKLANGKSVREAKIAATKAGKKAVGKTSSASAKARGKDTSQKAQAGRGRGSKQGDNQQRNRDGSRRGGGNSGGGRN